VVDVCSCPITFATSLIGTPSDTSQVAYEWRNLWNLRVNGRVARCSDGFDPAPGHCPQPQGIVLMQVQSRRAADTDAGERGVTGSQYQHQVTRLDDGRGPGPSH
jgi:hypothetical protein